MDTSSNHIKTYSSCVRCLLISVICKFFLFIVWLINQSPVLSNINVNNCNTNVNNCRLWSFCYTFFFILVFCYLYDWRFLSLLCLRCYLIRRAVFIYFLLMYLSLSSSVLFNYFWVVVIVVKENHVLLWCTSVFCLSAVLLVIYFRSCFSALYTFIVF